MSKVFVATLGYLLISVSIMEVFLQYTFLNIPWTPIIIVLLFLSFLFLGFERLPVLKDKKFIIYFLLLFITMVLFTVINSNYNILDNLFLYYLRVLFIFIILFSFYLVININICFPTFIMYNFLIYVLFSVIYIFIFWQENLLARPEGVLGISDYLAFLSILSFNLSEKKMNKFFIILISLIVLLFYSSFTSISIFIITLFLNIVYGIYSKHKVVSKIIITFLLIFLTIFSIVFYVKINSEIIQLKGNSLMIKTINNYLIRIHNVVNLEDLSLKQRRIQLQEGLKILKEKPILGEFMYEFRVFGGTGAYIHNILSYWAEYGLINFLLIFVPYFIYFYKSYKYSRKYNDKTSKALFFSGIYITLIVLFSRSYIHTIFWYYFALNMSYVLKFEREIKNKRVDEYILDT